MPVQAPDAPSGDADHETAPAPVAVPVSVLAPVQVTVRANGWELMTIGEAPTFGDTPDDIDGYGRTASDIAGNGRICAAMKSSRAAFTGQSRR